uniref:Plantacyanin n=1 Tax=Leersia perrieri TaxID=77586 RepID=A0A0D9VEE9_9ORYZ
MARAGSVCVAVLGLLLAVCCGEILVADAKEWTVGDSKGWTFGVAGWEKGKAFKAGDVLVFNYDPKMHNVLQVDEATYDSCQIVGAGADGGETAFNSGHDKITLAAGKAYYICSVPGHCANGMKIAVDSQ